MKTIKTSIAALLACAAVQAQASVITLQTAYSAATAQSSAAGYRDVVEKALLSQGAGYGTKTLSAYENVSNVNQFTNGSSSNIAWKATVDFTTATAANWSFRTAVDFGYGGAMFLDGVALVSSAKAMYATGYSDPSQVLQASAALAAGNHTLTIYGLEDCCSGVQQAQFKTGSAGYTTFSSKDGMTAKAVPEPATLASFGLGLGLLGFMRRRNKRG